MSASFLIFLTEFYIYRKLVKKTNEKQESISSEPIILNNRPSTPRLIQTVLEVKWKRSKGSLTLLTQF